MKLLFAASEVRPWSSTGGLSDVLEALPRALSLTGRHEVFVVSPLYRSARRVAERMGADLGFGSPPDPAKVMDEIAALSPLWRGVSYERLQGDAAFLQWPCESADDPGTAIVHEGGAFLSGKAHFRAVPWQEPGELPDDEFPMFLTTGRQLFHYNVGSEILDYLVDPAPLRIVDGYLPVLDRPGLGVEINEDVVVERARGGHDWHNPLWRHEDGSVAEW